MVRYKDLIILFATLVIAYDTSHAWGEVSLKADAGGPYRAAVGSDIVFNGSGSVCEGVCSYLWDFGDDLTSSGEVVKHKYLRPGFYKVGLTVSDSNGKSHVDYTGVECYTLELSVEVTLYPIRETYSPGDRLSGVDVVVYYPNGSRVSGAKVLGRFAGRVFRDLHFKEVGGLYHADLDYPILKEDRGFIDVDVEAADVYGNIGKRRYRVVLSQPDVPFMVVSEPSSRVKAVRGQGIDFKVRLINPEGGRGIEPLEVVLYDGWSAVNYSMKKADGWFVYRYIVPQDAVGDALLLFYAKATTTDGRVQTAVGSVYIELINRFDVYVVKPEKNQPVSQIREIVLNITYPDGVMVEDSSLRAYIDNREIVLYRRDGLFVLNYSPAKNQAKAEVELVDKYGNRGKALVEFTSVGEDEVYKLSEKSEGVIDPKYLWVMVLVGLFTVSASVVAVSLYYHSRRVTSLRKEFQELLTKRRALKKMMNSIMQEYYTRKITAEDTKKRVLDYEKELIMVRERMRTILHKAGVSKSETEGREEVIEWVIEKLEDGEDVEVIRKVLSDGGINPSIVDVIRKKLI